MAILVTGGAGYIGSHMTIALVEDREKVVVLDNLRTGVRALVPDGAHFIEGDIKDSGLGAARYRRARDRLGLPFRRLHGRTGVWSQSRFATMRTTPQALAT